MIKDLYFLCENLTQYFIAVFYNNLSHIMKISRDISSIHLLQ